MRESRLYGSEREARREACSYRDPYAGLQWSISRNRKTP
jgi:hypothetical protein